jgi:hypothetical protein
VHQKPTLTIVDGVTQQRKGPYKQYGDVSTIYKELGDSCFEHLGWWKAWIPFYGFVLAEEVLVSKKLTFPGDYTTQASQLTRKPSFTF